MERRSRAGPKEGGGGEGERGVAVSGMTNSIEFWSSVNDTAVEEQPTWKIYTFVWKKVMTVGCK